MSISNYMYGPSTLYCYLCGCYYIGFHSCGGSYYPGNLIPNYTFEWDNVVNKTEDYKAKYERLRELVKELLLIEVGPAQTSCDPYCELMEKFLKELI